MLKNDKIIDGVEVYHSSFTEKQSEKLLKYCNSSNELKVLSENIVLMSVTLLASLIEILPSLS